MNPLIAGNVRSKTSWVAVALIVLGAIEQSGLIEFVPDAYKGLALSVVGAVMLVLRNLTTESVAGKVALGDENDEGA